MASILFKIVRIHNSQFKCNYLKNEKLFLNFLLRFWNLRQNLNILKKRMNVIVNVFPKLETVKILLRPLSKSAFSEHALTVNMWKGLKYLQNIH